MGLLIAIVHDARVRDPAHAAQLLRALGASHVATSGWEPRTARELDHVIDTDPVDHANTRIAFERGTLSPAALDRLDELALAIETYLHISSRPATLRVWPHVTWMHGYERVADAEVSAILGRPVTIADGTTTIDDVTFKLPSANGTVPFDIETTRTAVATQMFRALTDGELTRGSACGWQNAAREPLRRFVHALGAETHDADLDLDLEVAVRLAGQVGFEALDWDVEETRITFPSGEISTYFVAPVPTADEAAWRARIADALSRC